MEDNFWKTILMASLQKAWSEDLLTDLVIVTQDETVKAHKIVLAVASPYFKALLHADLEEKQSSTLRLENVTGETMKIVLNYIYSGTAVLSEDNAAEILGLAEYFQIHDLKRLCCRFIKRHLSTQSYLPVYEIALLHNCLELANFCFQNALKHCSEVLQETSFLHLQPETVVALLKEPILDVTSEDELFQAGRKWLAFKEERTAWSNPVLGLINEKLLSPTSRSIYEEELEDRAAQSPKDRNVSTAAEKLVCSRHKKEEQLLIVFGGESNGRVLGSAECFVLGYPSWRCSIPHNVEVERDLNHHEGRDVIPPMSTPRVHAAVANKHNVVCIIGGETAQTLLTSVETYHISGNHWGKLPDLPLGLHGAGAVFHQNELWVVGGKTSSGDGNNAMMFDQKREEWCFKSPMNIGRVHFGVGAILGCIYAVGGWKVDPQSGTVAPGAISSCEKYCIETDTWTRIAPLGHRRSYHGVAVIHDSLYAIGGYDGNQWLSSVERYDPLKDRWERVSSMIGTRSSFGITVSNGRIYCMGGFSGSSVLNTVEKYNPVTDMWHCVQSMQLRRFGLVAVTLKLPSQKILANSKPQRSQKTDGISSSSDT